MTLSCAKTCGWERFFKSILCTRSTEWVSTRYFVMAKKRESSSSLFATVRRDVVRLTNLLCVGRSEDIVVEHIKKKDRKLGFCLTQRDKSSVLVGSPQIALCYFLQTNMAAWCGGEQSWWSNEEVGECESSRSRKKIHQYVIFKKMVWALE